MKFLFGEFVIAPRFLLHYILDCPFFVPGFESPSLLPTLEGVRLSPERWGGVGDGDGEWDMATQ